jgi:hypothetical protein
MTDDVPRINLARHIARLLQHDPTSDALRLVERGLTAGTTDEATIEAVQLIVHELDLLAVRSARWSERLRKAKRAGQ